MGDTNGRKIKRFLVGLTWKKKKSGKKYKKVINRYINILKKEEDKGSSKLLRNSKNQAKGRIKKYGINKQQIQAALEHKGLNHLISKIDL